MGGRNLGISVGYHLLYYLVGVAIFALILNQGDLISVVTQRLMEFLHIGASRFASTVMLAVVAYAIFEIGRFIIMTIIGRLILLSASQ
jgi:hypothetical protein